MEIKNFKKLIPQFSTEFWVIFASAIVAVTATYFYYVLGYVVAYGDAESHLSIAKRVIDSPTAGLAQLGGVWLPLPHILLLPFVYFDYLWQTGLAGSIVSGISFAVASLFIFKTTVLITENKSIGTIASLVFISNPNALYMQATAMTELLLIAFFAATAYYFIKYLKNDTDVLLLLNSAFLGFCTTLVRYDGWFLVLFMAFVLVVKYFPWKAIPLNFKEVRTKFDVSRWYLMEGRLIIFSTLAFFGVLLWFMWGFLILGDPLYFTYSEFSAKSQQNALLSANQLPAYHNIYVSFAYYFVTSLTNIGPIIFIISIIGFIVFLFSRKETNRIYIGFIFSAIFVFNVYTLYAGQSVIFIPALNPDSFKENIFNVRYGLMMLPFAATFFAYLIYKSNFFIKTVVVMLLVLQLTIFATGRFEIITLADGVRGISSSIADREKIVASNWMRDNYKEGYVLIDDYARPISIIESRVPMQSIIYIGSKPFWEESMKEPQKYAEWVVLKEGDTVWKNIYQVPEAREKLEQYFALVYVSGDRKIWKRNEFVN